MSYSLDLRVGKQLLSHVKSAEASLKMFQDVHDQTGTRKVELSYAKATLTTAVQRLRDFVQQWPHGTGMPAIWVEALRVYDPRREADSRRGAEEVLLHAGAEVQGLQPEEAQGLEQVGSADARIGDQAGGREGRLYTLRGLPVHRDESAASVTAASNAGRVESLNWERSLEQSWIRYAHAGEVYTVNVMFIHEGVLDKWAWSLGIRDSFDAAHGAQHTREAAEEVAEAFICTFIAMRAIHKFERR